MGGGQGVRLKFLERPPHSNKELYKRRLDYAAQSFSPLLCEFLFTLQSVILLYAILLCAICLYAFLLYAIILYAILSKYSGLCHPPQ